MLHKIGFRLAGFVPVVIAASAIAQPTVVLPPPADTDPPRTSIEDTRERYRASRAADKPVAETPADVVEVGEGAPARQIEPLDPALDPSSDQLGRAGAPYDPTLVRPILPSGYDRLELAEPVRAELLVIVRDHDAQIRAVLREFGRLHSQTIGIEAAALAESRHLDAPIVVGEATQERAAGFRPGNAPPVDARARTISEIPADSPYAAASADAWKRLHALHLKAVRLQAEKLHALEKNLTGEQIEVLRTYRTQARPAAAGVEAVEPRQPGVVTQPGTTIKRKVDVDRDEIEIEERHVTPDGQTIKTETEIPR